MRKNILSIVITITLIAAELFGIGVSALSAYAGEENVDLPAVEEPFAEDVSVGDDSSFAEDISLTSGAAAEGEALQIMGEQQAEDVSVEGTRPVENEISPAEQISSAGNGALGGQSELFGAATDREAADAYEEEDLLTEDEEEDQTFTVILHANREGEKIGYISRTYENGAWVYQETVELEFADGEYCDLNDYQAAAYEGQRYAFSGWRTDDGASAANFTVTGNIDLYVNWVEAWLVTIYASENNNETCYFLLRDLLENRIRVSSQTVAVAKNSSLAGTWIGNGTVDQLDPLSYDRTQTWTGHWVDNKGGKVWPPRYNEYQANRGYGYLCVLGNYRGRRGMHCNISCKWRSISECRRDTR